MMQPVPAPAARIAIGPPVPIAILGLAGFIISANNRTTELLLPVIAGDFATTIGRAALVTAAYTLAYGVLQLIYGPVGDRVGKLRVMTAALLACALATAACAAAPTLPVLIGLRFLSGATAAALIPLSMGYIADHVPYAMRQATLARFLLALSLGQVLGTSLSGAIGQYFGWRGVFVAFGLAGILAWAALVWRTGAARGSEAREATGSESRGQLSPAAYWQLLRQPATRVVIGGVFVEGVFLFSAIAYLGAALRERTGLRYTTIGLILSGIGVGGILYSFIAAPLIRRLGERGMILVGGGGCVACFLALAPAAGWWPFIPLSFLLGLAMIMLHATMQTKATELAPHARGTAIALFAFALFLGQGIGAATLGALVDSRGYGATFVLAGCATGLLALALAWLFGRQARTQPTATTESLAD
jgi:predicted MFS family arabinose efflux permease